MTSALTPPDLGTSWPDRDFSVLINAPPDPFEIRAFCICAINASGSGCMRRPRARAAHRAHRRSATTKAGDDGGGDGEPPGPPRLWRPNNLLRFPLRKIAAVLVTPDGDGGWFVLVGNHGWLCGSRDNALSEARWLADNHGLPVRLIGRRA